VKKKSCISAVVIMMVMSIFLTTGYDCSWADSTNQDISAQWQDKDLVGVVATLNTADIENRNDASHNYFDLNFYVKYMSYKPEEFYLDEELLAIDYMLKGNIRKKPYPEITYFPHKTDYYKNRERLQKKIEKVIADAEDEDNKNKFIENYAWLMLYMGEYEKVIESWGGGGQYSELSEESPSLHFCLAQAYFRLGQYNKSLGYAQRAYHGLEKAKLDTSWQVMLTEMGIYGKKFLDQPDGEIYTKKHIKEIFPHRSWEDFPFEDVTEKMGIERWGGTGSVSFADFDDDGWDDLLWERKYYTPQIYRNNEGKFFTAIAPEDLNSPLGSAVIFTPGDFNNDGLPDLFRHCCNYDGEGPYQLLKNLGDFKFEDVTEGSGINHKGAGMLLAWSDYNLDGMLDLLIADNFGPTKLYKKYWRWQV